MVVNEKTIHRNTNITVAGIISLLSFSLGNEENDWKLKENVVAIHL